VAAWQKKFGTERLPTFYASQGYDTALAIGAGLKGVNGNLSDTDAFRSAMLKADFHSVRGAFKFGNNQHPIQDWYALRVEKGADGKPLIKTVGKVLSDHSDAYAKECKL
jgi:branched-chain amino acid transport system substrate-binding protein